MIVVWIGPGISSYAVSLLVNQFNFILVKMMALQKIRFSSDTNKHLQPHHPKYVLLWDYRNGLHFPQGFEPRSGQRFSDVTGPLQNVSERGCRSGDYLSQKVWPVFGRCYKLEVAVCRAANLCAQLGFRRPVSLTNYIFHKPLNVSIPHTATEMRGHSVGNLQCFGFVVSEPSVLV